MEQKEGFLQKLIKAGNKDSGLYFKAGLLLLVGVALMTYGRIFRAENPANPTPPGREVAARAPAAARGQAQGPLAVYEEALAARLEGVLTAVQGAGEVDVTVTLESSPTSVVAVDQSRDTTTTQENDGQGGVRTTTTENLKTTTVTQRGTSSDQPLVLREEAAKVAGVLVVADGAAEPAVREMLTRAVTTNLKIPANRVLVVPRKAGE